MRSNYLLHSNVGILALVSIAVLAPFTKALAVPDSSNNGDGEYEGSDSARQLDSVGGGNILRDLSGLGGGHVLRELNQRQLSGLGGGHILRELSGLGGGHILRSAYQNYPNALSRFHSGGNKRNFDEIDHHDGWGRFVKRANFDEIDRSGFGRFVKRNFDEIDRAGFGRFVKKNRFDEIDRAGFGNFVN